MRAALAPSVLLAGLLLMGAAAPQTPEEVWKAGIADQNKDYSQTPHAMLKIQDSAYLHDGDTAVLQGQKGKPSSYHWSNDPKALGALTVTYRGGKIMAMQGGKALDVAL